MATFTNEEKLEAVNRELGFRRRVYGRKVESGDMTKEFADRQIGIFEAIAADYQAKVEGDRLL